MLIKIGFYKNKRFPELIVYLLYDERVLYYKASPSLTYNLQYTHLNVYCVYTYTTYEYKRLVMGCQSDINMLKKGISYVFHM